MAFLFRKKKGKDAAKRNQNRNISTRILQINLDEVKHQIDKEEEAKLQKSKKPKLPNKINKNDADDAIKSANNRLPDIKFRVEVEYNNHSWTVDRALNEFICLRSDLGKATSSQLRPFALFPYGVSGAAPSESSLSSESSISSNKKSKFVPTKSPISTNPISNNSNLANAEAPFLREIRLALDRWLDAIIANPNIQQTAGQIVHSACVRILYANMRI